MKYSFDELKRKISIIEIAEHYGYQYQRGEGVRVPVYRHENGDKIGIFNPQDSYQQRYFNMQDGTDKGSLYNFVKNRLSNGIINNPLSYPESNDENASINAVLHNYLNVPLITREKNRQNIALLRRQLCGEEEKVDYQEQLGKIEHKEFFYARGITDKTLHSELFKDRIFNIKGEYSIGFPLWNEDKIVGLEKRNRDVKKFYTGSDKANGIWHSNIPEKIQAVFVAETPLDCIAHRQLKGNDNTLYISFGGNLCATQILTINKLLNANREKIDANRFKFLLGSDNDSAGASYDLAFLRTQISLQGNISEQMFSKDMEIQKFEIRYKEQGSYTNALQMKELVNSDVKIEEKTGEEGQRIVIEYPNNMFAKRSLCEAMLRTHRLPFTQLEKAVMKDWNDDVMVLREINKNRQDKKLTYTEFASNKESYMRDCSLFEQKRLEQKKTVKM
ncbi:MAG: hypothetical protein M0P12_02160 [Paludibacteraceae bacterium]|nr:hypothetical protein [Paludibacteraceae bacterium]HOU68412.1 hypothetical protein [Paludibacteraceae bacterium]HQJ89164.1 hypothetical protein [Paludibacteraceae bacterium]